jgi:hypothetical protein
MRGLQRGGLQQLPVALAMPRNALTLRLSVLMQPSTDSADGTCTTQHGREQGALSAVPKRGFNRTRSCTLKHVDCRIVWTAEAEGLVHMRPHGRLTVGKMSGMPDSTTKCWAPGAISSTVRLSRAKVDCGREGSKRGAAAG